MSIREFTHTAWESFPGKKEIVKVARRLNVWWVRHSIKERQAFLTFSIITAAGLAWWIGVEAINTISSSREMALRISAELAEVRSLALESEALQKNGYEYYESAQIAEIIRAAIADSDLMANLNVGKENWEVILESGPADLVMEWLSALPIQPSLVELSRNDNAGGSVFGLVSGRIVFSQLNLEGQ